MKEKPDYEKLTHEILTILALQNLSLDMIYSYLIQITCSYAQAFNRNIDQIKEDVEIVFKSLPQPIEEIDDNTNEQPDSAGAK